jgi:Putative adhesin
MVPRSTLIAVLVGVEIALVVSMVNAVRGRGFTWFGPGVPMAQAGTSDTNTPRKPRTYQFPAGPNPAVVVDAAGVDVVLETRAVPQISVVMREQRTGPFFGKAQEITARDDGGTVHVTSDDVQQTHVFGSETLTLHIAAPANTRISVSDAGAITLAGFRAATSLDSRSGAVDVRDFRGDLTATTSQGRVDVSDADCSTLHVSSSDGRVVLRRVNAAQIDASSSNGRLEGSGLQLRDGTIATSNGRVSLGFTRGTDATVTAGTSNGRVNVSGLEAMPAKYVRHGGDDSDDDSSAAKTVRIGTGSGKLDVHTSNGSIDLNQEG